MPTFSYFATLLLLLPQRPNAVRAPLGPPRPPDPFVGGAGGGARAGHGRGGDFFFGRRADSGGRVSITAAVASPAAAADPAARVSRTCGGGGGHDRRCGRDHVDDGRRGLETVVVVGRRVGRRGGKTPSGMLAQGRCVARTELDGRNKSFIY